LGTKKWLIILPTIMAVEFTLARGGRGKEEEEENKNK
jgi:hypothetical protein